MTNNATRQAAYRARHLQDVEGQGMRLNTVVSIYAKMALQRLAVCYGVTQRQMLERLLDEAQRATLNQVAKTPGAQDAFYDGLLRLPHGCCYAVTPPTAITRWSSKCAIAH